MERFLYAWKKGIDMPGLTPKQEQFCLEYIKDFNGTRAAKEAGYSERSAKQLADQLLNKDYIREHIQELNLKLNQEPCIADAEEIRTFYSETMRDVNERTENRIKAADSLAKTYALFTDKVQMSGQVGVTIINDIPKEGE